jgi:soluble lytic murein transglycosylase
MKGVRPLCFLFLCIFLQACLASSPLRASPDEAKEALRRGAALLKENRAEDALPYLTKAAADLPAVGDYALLYSARALQEMGRHEEALAAVGKLLEDYPQTPLMQEARKTEILSAEAGDWDRTLELMKSYTADYPSDTDMRLRYGGLLKKRGRTGEADRVLKNLYIEACPVSEEAYALLEDSALTEEELFRRALAFRENRNYGRAEGILRELLRKDTDLPRKEVLGRLGFVLFMQKKYHQAGRILEKVGNLPLAARAYLRVGMEEAFQRVLDELISRKDDQAATLLIAQANGIRRKGDVQEALLFLSRVAEQFPRFEEDALWYKGWTLYRTKEYAKARDVFRELHEKHTSSKYLYWQARALERTGGDASRLYAELGEDDYYSFLSRRKTKVLNASASVKKQKEAPTPLPMERIDILMEVGLREEAVGELKARAGSARSSREVLDIARKLVQLGKYREAMLLTTRVPETMRPDAVVYPMAYWKTVQEVSGKSGLDPFLVLSLMREESRFDPEACSSAGAIGLMQLMPRTARRTAKSLGLSLDGAASIYDVRNNITLGSRYLKGLLNEFESIPAALAAYNAGAGRVREWLEGGYEADDEFIEDIPFSETRNYVKRILTSYYWYRLGRGGQAPDNFDIL